MSRFLLFAAVGLLTSQNLFAAEVGFTFAGIVFQPPSPAFGKVFPFPTGVVGRLAFETTNPLTHPMGGCDCAGYRQQLYNGFSASYGGLSVRADEYVVQITNDLPQGNGTKADIVRIVFSSNLDPPLQRPLFVDGMPQQTGLFALLLTDNQATALDSSALPEDINFSDFENRLLFLSDAPTGADVSTLVTSWQSLPIVPGDYDFDLDVDGADLLVWQREFGSSDALASDGNRDLIVDGADLDIWIHHYGLIGTSADAFYSTPIPEPSALWESLVLAVGCVMGQPRKKCPQS